MNKTKVDAVMDLVQEFASSYSLVGTRFEAENQLEQARSVQDDIRIALHRAHVRPKDIGGFVDRATAETGIARRTPAAIANRALDEMVELCLKTGWTAGGILGIVADALHNQALKAARVAEHTVFPSELSDCDESEISKEAADVYLILLDLAHVAGFDLDDEARAKLEDLKSQESLYVSKNGTIRKIKPHVIGGQS